MLNFLSEVRKVAILTVFRFNGSSILGNQEILKDGSKYAYKINTQKRHSPEDKIYGIRYFIHASMRSSILRII